jgi:hypothetical protein
MRNFILFTATLLTITFAQANDCALPVCDIPATIEQLKVSKQNDRYVFVKDLRAQYRGEANPDKLKNLKTFADEAKALFVSLNEEDWVIREAQGLKSAAVIGLIKYDKVETTYDSNGKNNLMRYFDGINDETTSYEVLSHWSANVTNLEDVDQVKAVVKLAEYAKSWAISTNQEAYIAREADKIIVYGGQSISRLFPSHEGTYKVKITCKPTPKDCGALTKTLTYMSIFDSLSTRGLVINLSDVIIDMPIYTYSSVFLTNAGTHLRGISTEATPNTRVSEINLDIDPKTGKVTGVLQDFGYIGEMYIEATPVLRVSKFFVDEGPTRVLDTSQAMGRYKGNLGTIEDCSLVVNRYSSGEIVALLDIGVGTPLSFRNGSFNAKHGVLSLTGTTPNMGDRKLILAFRRDKKGKEVLTGFMMTANPRSPSVQLYKVSDN